MRKCIAILLIAIIISFTAQAQSFELGVNAGTTCYPALSKDADILGAAKDKLATFGLSVMKNTKKWQYGLSCDYNQNDFISKYQYAGLIDYGSGTFPVHPVFYDYIYAHAQHENFKFFTNRKIVIGKIEPYAGFFIGGELSQYTNSGEDRSTDEENLFTAGLQAGCTWYVTKHIGINAQAAGAYNYDIHDAVKGDMTYPLTFGIRYRF